MITIQELKDRATALGLVVSGDKRCKYVWARAIAAYEATQAAIEVTADVTLATYALVAPIVSALWYGLRFIIVFTFFAGQALGQAIRPIIEQLLDQPHAVRAFGTAIAYHPPTPYATRWYASNEPGMATVHINHAAIAVFY